MSSKESYIPYSRVFLYKTYHSFAKMGCVLPSWVAQMSSIEKKSVLIFFVMSRSGIAKAGFMQPDYADKFYLLDWHT